MSGTKNKLTDLNDHLFEQLERLNNEKLKGEKLAEEIKRSEAITKIAGQVVNNAHLALKGQIAINDGLIKNPPKMLGIEAENKL